MFAFPFRSVLLLEVQEKGEEGVVAGSRQVALPGVLQPFIFLLPVLRNGDV